MLKIDILNEKENPFLKRRDLHLSVEHIGTATPKTEDLISKLAEKFKADQDKIEIVYIFSHKGIAKSKVKARIWKEKLVKKEKQKEEKAEGADKEAVEEKTNEA